MVPCFELFFRPGRSTAFSIAIHSNVTTIGATGFNLGTRVSR